MKSSEEKERLELSKAYAIQCSETQVISEVLKMVRKFVEARTLQLFLKAGGD